MGFVDLSNFYLDSSAIMQGQRGASSENTEQQASTAAGASDAQTAGQPAGFFGGSLTSIVLIYGAVIGGFYFLSIRPQRKRQKQVQEMQEALKVGDDVITSGGFFGKVADINADTFVIEFGTNKGVRVPVRKSDVFAAKSAPDAEGKKQD